MINKENTENIEDDKHCAPAAKYNNYSCFNINSIVKMIDIYNKNNKSDPILFDEDAINMATKNPGLYKTKLLKELSSKLSDYCDTQRCWVKHPVLNADDKSKDELLKIRHATFKPERPKGSEWLSNFDIGAVLNQYEKKYDNFHGFVYNYHDLIKNGYSFPDFEKIEKLGKTKLGYVYNTGSHWIPIFIDLKEGRIYNFDSRASEPEEDIPELINRAKKYIIKKGIEPKLIINRKIFQLGNDECGVYSIIFIIKMLEGMKYKDYTEWLKKIKGGENDEGINLMRDYFFTTYSLKKNKKIKK